MAGQPSRRPHSRSKVQADAAAVVDAGAHADSGAPLLRPSVRGADAVARVFAGRAELAEVAIIDGLSGAVFAPDGMVQTADIIRFGRYGIVGVEVVGEPSDLVALRIDPPAAATHPGS